MGAIKEMRFEIKEAYEAALRQYEEDCRAGRSLYEEPSANLQTVEPVAGGYQVWLNNVNGNIASYFVQTITKTIAKRMT
jgi:hypothetical protein